MITTTSMERVIERRQFRRAELDAPIDIRSAKTEQPNAQVTGQVKNVSLAGVYVYVSSPCPLQPGEQVICSIVVPLEQQRAFPFRRVSGKGWIVRLEPIARGRRTGESPSADSLIGMVVAFAPDVTALGAVTPHHF